MQRPAQRSREPHSTALTPDPLRTSGELRTALSSRRAPHLQPLREVLIASGAVHDTGIHRALGGRPQDPAARIGEVLLAAQEIGHDDLYRALSYQLGMPYARLGEFDVEAAALAALPPEIARRHRVLPLMFHDGRLVLATDDPANDDTLGALRFYVQRPLEFVLANPLDLDTAIATHYPAIDDGALVAEAEKLLRERGQPTDVAVENLVEERPIVRLVNNLLLNAVQRRASDIHLRPRERCAEVRYRIDGSLVEIGQFDRTLLPAVVARIKVLAGMNVAEHRLPQDGALRIATAHGPVDMRVSALPAVHGENLVIRVLDASVGLRRLADVGFNANDQRRLRGLLDRNQGLVLVTGPTGCGKTTTLYAALQELNTGEYHIVTVEDPVEYRLDGIVQVQVQPAIDFGFPQALRHILRHDPDVILVGEIRDAETARIAVESALTGHLVLSTLHTNSAAQTITRLVEIGIAPYLLNAALAGVLAQRLVRRNCGHCRVAEPLSAELRAALGVAASETFWRGRGCEECAGTGFHGRVAVYELLEMSPKLRGLVHAGAGHEQLEARAAEEGMVRLNAQALALARSGAIAASEVLRARLD